MATSDSGISPPTSAQQTGASGRLVWSTLDQALSSASNFVLIFLLARGSTPAEFGLLAIGYSLLTVAVAISRNAFGGILSLDLGRIGRREGADLVARSSGAVLALSVVPMLALAVYAVLALRALDGRTALLVIAVGIPVLLLQDLQRFRAVSIGRPAHAALADGIWLVVVLAAFLVPIAASVDLSAAVGAAAWVVGAACSLLVFVALGYRTRPRFDGLVGWLRGDARRAHLVSDASLASTTPLLNSSAVAAVGGADIVAAIRGSGVLYGPLNLITATIPMAVVPEAVRMGPDRSRRLFTAVGAGFATLALLWGVTLFLLPDAIGGALLGESWPLVQAIVLITAIEYVGLGYLAVAHSRLRVQGRLKMVAQLRLAYSLATLALPVAAVLVWGTAVAAAIGLAASSLAFAAASQVIARRSR